MDTIKGHKGNEAGEAGEAERWVALRPVGREYAMYVTRTAARLGEHVEVGGGYAVVERLSTAGLTQLQAAKAAAECDAQGVVGPRYSLHLPPFCQ